MGEKSILYTPASNVPTPETFGDWESAYNHLMTCAKPFIQTKINGVAVHMTSLGTTYTSGANVFHVPHASIRENIEGIEASLAARERKGLPPEITNLVMEQLVYVETQSNGRPRR